MTRDEVISGLKAILPELVRECHVESIGLCGSVARGEHRESSDVDVLVRFDASASVSLFTLAHVQRRLEETLGVAVDLIDDHPGLRPSLRRAIERDLIRVA